MIFTHFLSELLTLCKVCSELLNVSVENSLANMKVDHRSVLKFDNENY